MVPSHMIQYGDTYVLSKTLQYTSWCHLIWAWAKSRHRGNQNQLHQLRGMKDCLPDYACRDAGNYWEMQTLVRWSDCDYSSETQERDWWMKHLPGHHPYKQNCLGITLCKWSQAWLTKKICVGTIGPNKTTVDQRDVPIQRLMKGSSGWTRKACKYSRSAPWGWLIMANWCPEITIAAVQLGNFVRICSMNLLCFGTRDSDLPVPTRVAMSHTLSPTI
jgi:hypothetical protein